MFVDYILNGESFGEVAQAVQACRFDPGLMRPYLDDAGRRCVTVNTGRAKMDNKGILRPVYEKRLVSECIANGIHSPAFNAATSLRKDEWIRLDTQIVKEARKRLRAWGDLVAASSYGGFNAMSKTMLEHETMSDPGEAIVDMDGLSEGRTDAPLFQLEGLPLPITHSSFFFGSRRLAESRNTGTPLDTVMAEAAGRRVAEMIEKTLIGEETGVTYSSTTRGGYSQTPTVYGYTNYADRVTYTSVTTPTGSNPASTLANVLAMRDLLFGQNYFGPYMLYHTSDWDQYLDNDYYTLATTGATTPTSTLRNRLRAIEGIQDVRRLDYWDDTFSLLLVQMTSEVAQAVVGMDITTVQWETKGGMQLNFKVMAILVPRLRSTYSGNCGICHGTTS